MKEIEEKIGYLFIENKLNAGFVCGTIFATQIDRAFQPEFRYQNLQCIFAHKQNVAVLLLGQTAEE